MRYFLRRILYIVPLLLVISLVAFVLCKAVPGGPFDAERKPASPEIERNMLARVHLDEPAWKQYLRFLGLAWDRGPDGQWHHAASTWNLSTKYRNHDVSDVIGQGLPVSMTLGALAFCFALAVGIPLGFISAVNRGRWPDHLGSFLALLSVSLPSFVVAPILILIFSLKLKIFPVGLWESPWHMVLPAVALGSVFVGQVARLMREGMTQAAQSEFIVAARAKGLGETTLLLKHALRIALLPVVSYAGPMLADLLTGSFVVENIFQIPGIGIYFINSMLNRDTIMTIDLALLYALLLVGLNLAVDFAYTLLDPRVKYE
jgi:oligopeptide transport system permease protein